MNDADPDVGNYTSLFIMSSVLSFPTFNIIVRLFCSLHWVHCNPSLVGQQCQMVIALCVTGLGIYTSKEGQKLMTDSYNC